MTLSWNFFISWLVISRFRPFLIILAFFSNNFDVLSNNCDFLSSNVIISIYDLPWGVLFVCLFSIFEKNAIKIWRKNQLNERQTAPISCERRLGPMWSERSCRSARSGSGLMLMMWHQQRGGGEGTRAEAAPTRPHSDAWGQPQHADLSGTSSPPPAAGCFLCVRLSSTLREPTTTDVLFVFSCGGDVELKADIKGELTAGTVVPKAFVAFLLFNCTKVVARTIVNNYEMSRKLTAVAS